ncbi:GNAT family N-acetyltransferase [Phragmitibacter flavus]|uniref:GNAT family N-acetyltransferase n=1 Tax=Phragmitibacter flavus TaxID=2576071 RepID=A0A5R8KDP8_9BACT|nr:GNAT family N-acetyltransferase [Phragmitibacter flavus]TLD70424.1 GNAT family N-acetyltransferase [Phragmitibacter flavus]
MWFKRQSKPIQNALTGAPYFLQSLDSVDATDDQLERITSICNEPAVYRWLFESRYSGQPYPGSSAAEWLSWGADGWINQTHFAFAVLNAEGRVAAACDIKDTNRDSAEIGYWSGAAHRGIMTNAVQAMLELGLEAGFRGFFAEVHQENLQSRGVLTRAGLQLTERSPRRPFYLIYECVMRMREHPGSC